MVITDHRGQVVSAEKIAAKRVFLPERGPRMAALAAAALAGLLVALAPVVGADTDAAGGNAGPRLLVLGRHSLCS